MSKVKQIKIHSKNKKYFVNFEKFSKLQLKNNTNDQDLFIVDKNVFRLHKLNKIIQSKNLIVIKASEKNKKFENLSSIIKKILYINFTRNAKMIVIGGGITQDIGSFIASIIFRGVEWVFFPTSFLAQCDSCIGGKTSINFNNNKNQIGNFYPPSKIFINTYFLTSQDKKNIRSGVGEMSHFFFVSSEKDFLIFKNNYKEAIKLNTQICEKLIYRSLMIKKLFIEKDEFDTKERLILNYGHTFGHAIEAISNYKIPHGLAVANGINIANFISYKFGYLSKKNFEEMYEIVKNIYKNDKPHNLNINRYISFLKKDKKNINKNLRAVLTRGIGKMFIKEIEFDIDFFKILHKYKSLYL